MMALSPNARLLARRRAVPFVLLPSPPSVVNECELSRFFHHFIQPYASRAAGKGLAVLLDCAAGSFRGDTTLLRQALGLLLDHLINQLPHGRILVSVDLGSDDDGRRRALLVTLSTPLPEARPNLPAACPSSGENTADATVVPAPLDRAEALVRRAGGVLRHDGSTRVFLPLAAP